MSHNSPKLPFRVDIHYSPALDFGSVVSYGADTFDAAQHYAHYDIDLRRSSGYVGEAYVRTMHNDAGYPNFDWRIVDTWKLAIGKAGGARPGSGRKATGVKTATVSFRLPAELTDKVKQLRAAGVDVTAEVAALIAKL